MEGGEGAKLEAVGAEGGKKGKVRRDYPPPPLLPALPTLSNPRKLPLSHPPHPSQGRLDLLPSLIPPLFMACSLAGGGTARALSAFWGVAVPEAEALGP